MNRFQLLARSAHRKGFVYSPKRSNNNSSVTALPTPTLRTSAPMAGAQCSTKCRLADSGHRRLGTMAEPRACVRSNSSAFSLFPEEGRTQTSRNPKAKATWLSLCLGTVDGEGKNSSNCLFKVLFIDLSLFLTVTWEGKGK